MNSKILQLTARSSYGHARYYALNEDNPQDCAHLFLRLLNQTSFTVEQLKIIRQLGFESEVFQIKANI